VGLFELAANYRNPVIRTIFKNRKNREADYLESVDKILQFKRFFERIYLLECLSRKFPEYLKSGGCAWRVSRNSLDCANKGIQEFVNIANFLEQSDTDDAQLIVKITGRYLINRENFLLFCSCASAEAIVRRDSDIWGDRGKGVHTFLFAARKRLLVRFGKWLIEGNRFKTFGTIPVEWIFHDYLVNSGCDITLYPDKLHVSARYAHPLTAIEV